jgi:hypothetical protein
MPTKAKRKAGARDRLLLYRVAELNGGVVFARADRAMFIAKLHRGLNRARTWGEFRKAIPPAEYSQLMRENFDEQGEKRPRSSDPFSGEEIGGWCDGDYPPWLQQEMEQLAPDALWDDVATHEETQLNGSFLMIPEKNLKAACKALRDLGWTLKRAQRLEFY